MLEIRNISKTYRAKSGVSVRALDNVSITFAETGMVFLLGKSGSGKSTLLNVIGGLDSFDEGEVIIKGRSSRKFKGSDFDAYRNTFIGFIFQEYNILDEFTVGANIALALELQGKKATSEAINTILEQVDLLDFANRKPNELSGGQKQRIAIARALIKDPQIIMADEPTGALDSETGKQVLETLKKLSKTKLVLVVSHDREFAETYGDRIIELMDGRVISDMSGGGEEEVVEEVVEEVAEEADEEEAPARITVVDDSIIHIPRGYTLTLEDMDLINAYLRNRDRDIVLSKDEEINAGVQEKKGIFRRKAKTQTQTRTVVRRKAQGTRQPTGEVPTRKYNPEETRFIKSRLPMKNAVKMGTASMKAKPGRLIFTIFLSFLAFAMFGLSDTMAAYNQFTATVDSIQDSQMRNIALTLTLRETYSYKKDGEWTQEIYYGSSNDNLNAEDIAYLKEITGLNFKGVYSGSYGTWNTVSLSHLLVTPKNLQNDAGFSFFQNTSFTGITELTEEEALQMGYTIEGRFPQNDDEIVIPKFIFQMLKLSGVRFGDGTEILPDYLTAIEDDEYSILGKEIKLFRRDFTIVGVLDTGYDFDNPRYEIFHWDYNGVVDQNNTYTLQLAMESEQKFGYHTVFVGYPGIVDKLPVPDGGYIREFGAYYNGFNQTPFITDSTSEKEYNYKNYIYRFVGNQDLHRFTIAWLADGKTSLGAKDIIMPISFILNRQVKEFGSIENNRVFPEILKGVIEYEEQYNMWQWSYDPDRTMERPTVYELYVAHCEKEGVEPLAFKEYQSEIFKFYNAYYGFDENLPPEIWHYALGYWGCIIGTDTYSTMGFDQYVQNRGRWHFILDHWDAVVAASKESTSPFYEYLQSLGESVITATDGAEYMAQMLVYAGNYMNEVCQYNGEAMFGTDITYKQMYDAAQLTCQSVVAEHYNKQFGVEFSYDMWMGIKDNVNSHYFRGYGEDMDLSSYVMEKEILNFILQNLDTIKAESEDKDSDFALWLAERYGGGEEYFPNKPGEKPNNKSDDYNDGVLLARAFNYVSEKIDDRMLLFDVDFQTLLQEKSVEYAMAGLKNLTLPKIYFGYEQFIENASSVSVIEKNSPYTIVGFFVPENNSQTQYILSEVLYQKALATIDNDQSFTTSGEHNSGRYIMALAALPEGNREVIETIATLHNRCEGEFEFRMENNVADVLDNWGEGILLFNKIFLYVGIGFAVFAALMMLNFISVSVTYKKKEIGILRALGARSSDVFSIFFSEAFFIALINFVLATGTVFGACILINYLVRTEMGFVITLLHPGVRQILLVFGVSVLVAFIGSFLPVRKIAKKNPIDAMKDR